MCAIFEAFDTFTTEPIAIRGDRVALIRIHLARDGFTTTMLGVYEADERGLLTRGSSFDEDDFDLALDDLEERFIAGDGAPHEYLIRRSRDFTRSLASLDGAATLALMSRTWSSSTIARSVWEQWGSTGFGRYRCPRRAGNRGRLVLPESFGPR